MTTHRMVSLAVAFDPADYAALKAISKSSAVPCAVLVRAAVAAWLADTSKHPRAFGEHSNAAATEHEPDTEQHP